ncbi:uncharacterized protein LOC130741041 [Lotus japonicus]|uniref:uncharacterized protein LOC130741041 n=1 Tax=Lotus japonicus TaxID=34305 RepID=UPI002587B4B4|nr:uncharacterized protein LOC130741041 [Lotus japonicus]
MAEKNKYYVVFKGKNVRIIKDWISCHAQVVRYNGRLYDGFEMFEEAETTRMKLYKDEIIPQPIEDVKESQTWNASASSSEEVSFEEISLLANLSCFVTGLDYLKALVETKQTGIQAIEKMRTSWLKLASRIYCIMSVII